MNKCPICGGNDVAIEEAQRGVSFEAVCKKGGLRGRSSMTVQGAIDNWNGGWFNYPCPTTTTGGRVG